VRVLGPHLKQLLEIRLFVQSRGVRIVSPFARRGKFGRGVADPPPSANLRDRLSERARHAEHLCNEVAFQDFEPSFERVFSSLYRLVLD